MIYYNSDNYDDLVQFLTEGARDGKQEITNDFLLFGKYVNHCMSAFMTFIMMNVRVIIGKDEHAIQKDLEEKDYAITLAQMALPNLNYIAKKHGFGEIYTGAQDDKKTVMQCCMELALAVYFQNDF